jgi:UDP-2,3-diacylglucosamine hydrolase
MAIYFFSDAHLGENDFSGETKKMEKINGFIDLVRSDGKKLYILGDLFEFWFEYAYAIPKGQMKVIFRLAQLVDEGIEIHYLPGNHDFWLGDFLQKEAGLIIHDDYYTTVEQDKKLILTHGDGIAPSDKGYRFLKRILRNKVNIWLYRKVPADWGIPLARWVAARSRAHTSKRSDEFLKEYDDYAARKIREGFNAVIMGHLHVPVIKELNGGHYINTGDFISNFSYVRMKNGKFSLEYI